jgi:hypothetical protein
MNSTDQWDLNLTGISDEQRDRGLSILDHAHAQLIANPQGAFVIENIHRRCVSRGGCRVTERPVLICSTGLLRNCHVHEA